MDSATAELNFSVIFIPYSYLYGMALVLYLHHYWFVFFLPGLWYYQYLKYLLLYIFYRELYSIPLIYSNFSCFQPHLNLIWLILCYLLLLYQFGRSCNFEVRCCGEYIWWVCCKKNPRSVILTIWYIVPIDNFLFCCNISSINFFLIQIVLPHMSLGFYI